MARTYKVVAGDTLAKLAERFYGDSALYPLIAAANGIANPAQISVGQLLVIPEAPEHWELYQSGGNMINDSIGRCILPVPVPAGRRLVIETVTGYYYLDGGVIGAAYLSVNGLSYAFPWVQCGSLGLGPSDRRFFGFTHAVRLYVDGPATLQFDADGGAFSGGGDNHPSGGYTVTGHLEALPTT